MLSFCVYHKKTTGEIREDLTLYPYSVIIVRKKVVIRVPFLKPVKLILREIFSSPDDSLFCY